MNKLSQNLKMLITKHQITETELARRTGVGQPVIHRISSGETDNPKVGTVAPLAKYFQITVSQLIGDTPLPKDILPSPSQSSVEHWVTLALLDLEAVCGYLSHPQSPKAMREISVESSIPAHCFACIINDTNMMPLIHPNSTIIVNPKITPKDNDYIMILKKSQRIPSIRQLFHYDDHTELASLNPDFGSEKMVDGDQILGVVIQVQHDR